MSPGKYKGNLFGPWEPGKSFPAQIEVGFDGFRLSLEDGRNFEIPYENAKLSRGGFDGLGIIIEGLAAASGESLYIQAQDEALLHELESLNSHALRERIKALISEGKSTHRSWFFSSTFLIALLVGSGVFLWWGLAFVSERATSFVPTCLEAKLGEMTAHALLSGRKELKSGPVYTAIRDVWQKTSKGIPQSPYAFKLYVADTSMVNALAAPGGHVIVFTGLLTKLESPEELAGILAHEAQHALRRHGLQSILKSAGLAATLGIIFGDTGALGELFKNFGGSLLKMSYSRDAEKEADQGAVDILVAAGIDPTQFPAFFRRVSSGSEALEHTLAILSTHPSGSERERELQKIYATLPEKTYKPMAIDWKLVKKSLQDSPPPMDPGF